MTLHEFLDRHYGADGNERLHERLATTDVDLRDPTTGETPLHVAVRRRRLGAATILLDHGADIDATTRHGKSAYAHATRRGFGEITSALATRGADLSLSPADEFAVAVIEGRLDDARQILVAEPGVAHTGNPEEDRLLPDCAGRSATEPVKLLIGAGADLGAPGLDGGTPLHQAAWFGRPENARLLLDAGAPANRFDDDHTSSPLGWAVHGARYSGGAAERFAAYEELVHLFLGAGSQLHYPGDTNNAFLTRLLADAPPSIAKLLREAP